MEEKGENRTIVRVKISPRSSSNQVLGKEEGVFKIKLTAPPVEGKANKGLKQFLAKRLGLSKRDVQLISGERSRLKSFVIHGLPRDIVEERLLEN
jgi:uncharacterized protein (TIGR00251 family)